MSLRTGGVCSWSWSCSCVSGSYAARCDSRDYPDAHAGPADQAGEP